MKEKEIEITKVVLKLGAREVELTVDEARKLKSALDGLFKEKEIVREVHHHDYWRWYWNQPIYNPITTTYPSKPAFYCTTNVAGYSTLNIQI